MSAEEIAQAFTQHYYTTFDTNVAGLASMFTDKSMMTFEGTQVGGQQPIMNKLQSVGQVQHVVKSLDVQPSTSDSAIVLFVTGTIKIGGDNPLHFCEMFQLVAHAPGQYYVHNDVFRLNYGL